MLVPAIAVLHVSLGHAYKVTLYIAMDVVWGAWVNLLECVLLLLCSVLHVSGLPAIAVLHMNGHMHMCAYASVICAVFTPCVPVHACCAHICTCVVRGLRLG
jgi:hypothetical protein